MRIVSGMHRSGTSLLARLLHDAGADLGDADSFYPADQWNPAGYYEQRDVHAINMPLIHGRYGKLAYFHLPSVTTVLRRADRRSRQIRAAARKYDRCVVKEARFCLTLPAWLRHGAAVETILVCLRNPFEVARSLRRRNKIPLALGYRLWRQHNERLLGSVGDIPHRFVLYEANVNEASYIDEIQPALSFMGIARSRNEVAELCADKIHFRSTPAAFPETAIPSSAARLWSRLLELHAAQPAIEPELSEARR